MIKILCLCVDDTNKPDEIPEEKWIVKDQEYHITLLHPIPFKGGIKVNIHREIKGKIGKFTISKTPTGKYFVSILTEQEYIPSKKTGKSIGIDLGIKDFAITKVEKPNKTSLGKHVSMKPEAHHIGSAVCG